MIGGPLAPAPVGISLPSPKCEPLNDTNYLRVGLLRVI